MLLGLSDDANTTVFSGQTLLLLHIQLGYNWLHNFWTPAVLFIPSFPIHM